MTYIKKEDVLKPLMKLIEGLERVKETGGKPYSIVLGPVIQDLMQLGIDINSLPSIDFEGMIEQEIYGLYTVNADGEPQNEYYSEGQIALRNLFNKLP